MAWIYKLINDDYDLDESKNATAYLLVCVIENEKTDSQCRSGYAVVPRRGFGF